MVKNPSANAGDVKRHGFEPCVGKIPGGGHGNLLQHSRLEDPHGQGSLVGFSSQGHKESDTAEAT